MEKIIDWEKSAPKQVEIPFKPARVLLQVGEIRNDLGDAYTILVLTIGVYTLVCYLNLSFWIIFCRTSQEFQP